MNIERLLHKKGVAQRVQNFSDFTGLNVTLMTTEDGKVIFGDGNLKNPGEDYLPIRINGEEMFRLFETDVVFDRDKNTSALEFLKNQLEEILNSEFNKQDLVKTTARFWKEMNFIYNFLTEINYSLDIEQICQIITDKIVKLLGVAKVRVVLLGDSSLPELKASFGYEKSQDSALIQQVDFLISLYVIKTSEDILLDDLDNLSVELHKMFENEQIDIQKLRDEFEPLIYCALKTPEKTIGTIKICSKKNGKFFSSDDLKLLSSIASQVSLVLDNVQMIAKIQESEKIRQEMEVASAIQKGLLPKQVPKVESLDIDGRCVSANAVGGDYYDFIKLDSNINFVLADVAGHGMSSALYMSNVRSILRSILSDKMTLPEVAHRVNNYICSDSGTSGMFVTLFYARYYFRTSRLEFVNSGHNLPILYHSADGTVELLDTEGTPAGFIEDTEYLVKSTCMQSGDVLVIYTDGFIEAPDCDGGMFGTDALIELVKKSSSLSANELIDKIYEQVYSHSKGIDQKDDMTILVVKHT